MKYIEVKNDLFDIANRIKQIDPKYFVVFNIVTKKFEVHYKRAKNTYELTLPYDALDARAVDFVQKTKVENSKKIFEEMELQNQKLAESIQSKTKQKIERSIYES